MSIELKFIRRKKKQPTIEIFFSGSRELGLIKYTLAQTELNWFWTDFFPCLSIVYLVAMHKNQWKSAVDATIMISTVDIWLEQLKMQCDLLGANCSIYIPQTSKQKRRRKNTIQKCSTRFSTCGGSNASEIFCVYWPSLERWFSGYCWKIYRLQWRQQQ